MEKLPIATHPGVLKIDKIEIYCAVLDDETRILSTRSVANAFGVKGGGEYWRKKRELKSAVFPEYLSAAYLRPFISSDLGEKLFQPLKYIGIKKRLAYGLEATILPDICDVWIRAKEAGALPKNQERIAHNAYVLMRGFANIGIIALIDEATNYQIVRDRNALQKILDKYLLNEYAKWAKRFPDEFYVEMFRLKGWQWKGMKVNRPSVVGHYTRDLVYSRLAPEVLGELEKRNPPDESGKRKSKHHQWLTEDVGHPALQKHLTMLIALEKASANWGMFYRMVQRALPKLNEQIPLPLEE